MTKYIVLTETLVDQWCNVFTDEDGKPVVFDSEVDAEMEIQDILTTCELKGMEGYTRDGYRIHKIERISCAKCGQSDKWRDDDIEAIENGEVWCTSCNQNTFLV